MRNYNKKRKPKHSTKPHYNYSEIHLCIIFRQRNSKNKNYFLKTIRKNIKFPKYFLLTKNLKKALYL